MSDAPWRPSRPAALTIAVASVWPLVYFCVFSGFFFYILFARNAGSPEELFKYVFILHLLTMLLMFVLMAVYIVHLFRTDLVPTDKKALWAIVLFFGNVFAFPVYWYLYMWRPLRADMNQ